MKQKKKKKTNRFMVIILLLIGICFIYTIAPNYQKTEKKQFTIWYHNQDKTSQLKQQEKINENEVYLEMEDIHSLFQQDIYLDETGEWIVTISSTKVAAMNIHSPIMEINSVEVTMDHPIICEQDHYYIPLSELEKIYNIETKYIEETKTEWIDPKDQELISADINKKVQVKSEKKTLCRTIETLKKGDSIILISEEEDGWAKVRTQKGNVGYIKQTKISNLYKIRENMEQPNIAEEETTVVTNWKTLKKIKTIPLVDIQQYKERQSVIENIVDQCVMNGISCLEFQDETLQKQDEVSYNRFQKELEARLAEVGIGLK